MLSVDSQVGKVGNTGTRPLSDEVNGSLLVSGPNLKVEIPPYEFLGGVSNKSSKGILLGRVLVICDPVLGVLGGLINLPIIEDV